MPISGYSEKLRRLRFILLFGENGFGLFGVTTSY